MAIGKGTGKKQRCRKASVFPCKTRCVPRYNSRSGKEQRCRNVAEGAPSTYLQWIKSQDERKGKINAKRQKQGQTLFESDSAGYLVNPDKNTKGKLPAIYREKAEKARKIGAESQDPKVKALAEKTAKKAEAVAEKAEQLTAPAQDELSRRRAAKDKKPSAPVEPAPSQAKPKRRAAKEKTAPKPKSQGKTGYTLEEQSALDHPHKQNLYGLAMGLNDARSKNKSMMGDLELHISTMLHSFTQKDKVQKLIKDGLSQSEANAVAAWISDGLYELINMAIYDPQKIDPGKADYAFGAGIRAAEGLRKLPSYTHTGMVTDMLSMGQLHDLLPEGKLTRGIEVTGDLDTFLAPYIAAVGKPEYKEPTFFAASAQKQNFFNTGNVIYEIQAKSDGTGQGKPMDTYKNALFEGEVIYPPYSRFKVTKVEKIGNGSMGNQMAIKIKTDMSSNELNKLPKTIQSELDNQNLTNETLSTLLRIGSLSSQYHAAKESNDSWRVSELNFVERQLQKLNIEPLSKPSALALLDILYSPEYQFEDFGKIKIYMEEL